MTLDFDSIISAAVGRGDITGASFAYWDGERLHTGLAGVRNSITGDPLTPDTLMHIGSITKVVNTALFMQLVDDGLIDLDDPVTRHLPDLRIGDEQALARITCRMLVNHTNGIDYDCPDYHPFDEQRIVDSVLRCATKGQIHAPGTAASYSNIGMVIAGHLAQTLRGDGWYNLIRDRIFTPLGLDHALVDITQIPRFRVSLGDQTGPNGEVIPSARPFLPISYAPAGATMMMTAPDLVTIARALINGGIGPNGARILSEKSAAAMATETSRFAAPANLAVGLGWMLLPGGVLHHSGGGPGVAAELYAHPATGRAFALLMNSTQFRYFKPSIIDPILESWGALEVPAQPLPPPDNTEPYEGLFGSSLITMAFFSEGGQFKARMGTRLAMYESMTDAAPGVDMVRIGQDLFQVTGLLGSPAAQEIGFAEPDATGRMQTICYYGRIMRRCDPV
jgi:CubicO group peptidase (beta-lactamase class C family)